MAGLSYAFDPSAGETPDTVARRRQTADALAARIFGRAPQNLGEGLNAIGQALIARQMANEADAAQNAGTASIPAWAGGPANPSAAVASAITGQPPPAPTAPAASAPAPGNAASAIASIESGGKYDLLGPVTKTGDRAYGKYQVMGANIPQWTKAFVGREMTPQEFLASPEAQDAVFNGQFGQYAQKYGPEGAAKAWFAGEKGMQNPNARDQLGTTVQAYADRFSKAYGGGLPYQVAGPPTAAPSTPPAAAPDASSQAALSTGAPPVQSAPPAAQPRSQSYGGPFPNVPTADLTKQAVNPWVPAATRQVLGAEVARRATMDQQASDPVRQLDIRGKQLSNLKAERDLQGEGAVPLTAEERMAYGIPEGQPAYKTRSGEIKFGPASTKITNNVGGGSDKQIFDTFAENTKEARAAATGLTALRTARQSLHGPGGAITGFGADERLGFQKLGAALGLANPEAIQNTETFRAAIAPQVAATLKATVGTANISNSDREFAEKAAGGSIKLDAGSIDRLLNIMEKAGTARLQLHQQQLDAVYPDPVQNRRERALFGVQMPEAPQPPAAPAAQNARPAAPQPGEMRDGYRFKGGNPADPKNWDEIS